MPAVRIPTPLVSVLALLCVLAISPPGHAGPGTAETDASLLPFSVDPSTLAHMRGHIGQSCDLLSAPQSDAWTGFLPIKGFAQVVTRGGTVRPMMRDQTRFAFLTTGSGDGCRISDVVVLPDPGTANVFEQCDASGSGSPDGIAMRQLGEKKLIAYWAIDPQSHRFRAQANRLAGKATALSRNPTLPIEARCVRRDRSRSKAIGVGDLEGLRLVCVVYFVQPVVRTVATLNRSRPHSARNPSDARQRRSASTITARRRASM